MIKNEQEKKVLRRVNNRLILLLLIFTVSVFVIISKLFSIQILETRKYRELAKRQQTRKVVIKAPRGNIVDRHGIKLARSERGYSFAVDPSFLKELITYRITKASSEDSLTSEIKFKIKRSLEKERQNLASIFSLSFGKPKNYYLKLLERDDHFVWVARHVPVSKAQRLLKLKNRAVLLFKEEIRLYENLAAQLVGITDVDNDGVAGIEKVWNKELTGDPGIYILEKALKGKTRRSIELPQKEPKKGGKVELTIDAKMQSILEDELKKGMLRVDADAAFGAIMHVKTGEMLAMANMPSFDMNTRKNLGLGYSEKNRLVTESLEPGSVFKLVSIALATEKKLISPETIVYGENGTYKLYDRVIKDHQKLDKISFKKAVMQSSNIVIAKLSKQFTDEDFYEKVLSFGFGKKTGINIPGEVSGKVKPPSEWTGITKAWMSHGYEVQATPIQILSAYAAVANNGVLMKPFLVRRVRNLDDKTVYESKPKQVKRVLSKSVAKKVTDYLVAIVDSGTATSAQIEGFEVAGKTGTAQQYTQQSYQSGNYFSSFVGYFPAKAPVYAIIIGVQNPKKGYYASVSSAPVFSEVGSRVISNMNEVSRNILLTQRKTKSEEEVLLDTAKITVVPNLKGLSAQEAKSLLRFHGLDVYKRDFDKVIKMDSIQFVQAQKIPPGTPVPIWSKVSLSFTQKGRMPNLKSMRIDRAINIARYLGINVKILNEGDRIAWQFPKPGKKISKETICQLSLN